MTKPTCLGRVAQIRAHIDACVDSLAHQVKLYPDGPAFDALKSVERDVLGHYLALARVGVRIATTPQGFIQAVAALHYDGEENADGEPFDIPDGATYDILVEVIKAAREVTAPPSQETTKERS